MPIGEGAVPTISSSIGQGASPSVHHHTQHRTGSTIGAGATPSFPSFPSIGSGATPSSSPFTIGTGARPTTTATTRNDPFADFNKPRTTSSLFPPRETRNDRSSSFGFGSSSHNHGSLFDERPSRSHTVCHVETGGLHNTHEPAFVVSTGRRYACVAISIVAVVVVVGMILVGVFAIG